MRGVWWGTLIVLGILLAGGDRLLRPTAAAPPLPAPGALAVVPPRLPSATPTPPCAGEFGIIANPEPPGVYQSRFQAADALNAQDVWAVGEYDTFTSNNRPLIEHWDGTGWDVVGCPVPDLISELHGIAALAGDNVWAAGYSLSSGTAPRQTLIEHWDGSAWRRVPSPNRGSGDNELSAIAALGPDNVWAVGWSGDGNGEQPLSLHWDGTSWNVVDGPPITPFGGFQAIAAMTANDIWAVGYAGNTPNPYQTLVEHWDGGAWEVVPNPNPGTGSRAFWGVAAAGPSDVWAVGQYNSLTASLIEHWNGFTWSVVPSPNVGMLLGIVVRAPNDIWASSFGAFVLHWDGSTWTRVPTTLPSNDNSLQAIVAAGPELWAVGYYGNGAGLYRTLIERHFDTCPTPSATPIPTNTPTATPPPNATTTPTPTASAPPAATASPTSCSVQFNDAPPGSTFYSWIRCLACRGIVGGYPCGSPGEPCPGSYYRPNNNVTRGQAAKIVSESARFADPVPSSQQTFADVPPGSAFHPWIERLAGRGIIGGYPCGGPFEPCIAPANRPYFRPNAPVTRGQLAQIVAGAAGYTETPTGQTFADVPPGSPFYRPVERLAERATMSGYPCGGPVEPCIAPNNRPYFRPNTPTTRGQAAKIVANTFLPACEPP